MIQRKKKGFSLVEMLVVIAIIAVLTAIVVPVVGVSRTKAAAATNAANLRAAKGAFTTLKLMYPDNYSKWTGGMVALAGVNAVDEEFVVSSDYKANKATAAVNNGGPVLLSDSDELTVPAPNAVALKLKDVNVDLAEGTVMTVQVLKLEGSDEPQVYVTYNGLPISFFAEVAEKGTANPADHKLSGRLGNLSANQAYIDRYTQRAQELYDAMDKSKLQTLMGATLAGQIANILDDPASQGDCIECAINNLNFRADDADLLNMDIKNGQSVADKIEQALTKKGYQYSGGNSYCSGYTPKNGKDGACTCNDKHGPDSHLSVSESIKIGNNFEDENCPKGGTHTYERLDRTHTCTKCGAKNGKSCPTVDKGIPYIGALVNDSCIYCEYCTCCAAGKYYLPTDGVVDGVVGSLGGGLADMDICITLDPLTGGKSKGCGHTATMHKHSAKADWKGTCSTCGINKITNNALYKALHN